MLTNKCIVFIYILCMAILSVCLSVAFVYFVETAERVELVLWTQAAISHAVLQCVIRPK